MSAGKQTALLFEHEDGKIPVLFWVLRKIGIGIIIIIIIIMVYPRTGHEGSEGEYGIDLLFL